MEFSRSKRDSSRKPHEQVGSGESLVFGAIARYWY